MDTILIVTKPDDTDAMFVAQALAQYGHQATIWFPSDIPVQQYHAFSISDQTDLQWTMRGHYHESMPASIDTVWFRRPRKPVLPDTIHPDDRDNLAMEHRCFFESLWYCIAPNAFWVNSIDAIYRVKSKLKQLMVAKSLGLQIPPTLLSNDPNHIREFINRFDKVIYKPQRTHFWMQADQIKTVYTQQIYEKDLPDDAILQLQPGLFQQRLDKAYELRVTCLGHYHVAVKIDSQSHPRGRTDWRAIPARELPLSPYVLPPQIHEKCIAFMKAFGLQMACFDFIVSPDQSYYFLEANEQGQFLWLEEYCPEIPMLDIFTQFLLNSRFDFEYHATQPIVSLNQFRSEVQEQVKLNMATHQQPPLITT